MANPARVPDPRHTDPHHDPLNPVPPAGADAFTPRDPANTSDPRVVNRVERGTSHEERPWRAP